MSSKAPSNARVSSGGNTASANTVTSSQPASSTTSRSSSSQNESSSAAIDTDTVRDSDTDSEISSDIDTDGGDNSDTDIVLDSDSDIIDSDTDIISTDTDIADTDTSTDTPQGSIDPEYMSFTIDDSKIYVGQSIGEVSDILGEYSSAADVENGKVYTFEQCNITVVYGDYYSQIVSSIEIVSPNYSIAKGIKIGSTVEELKEAFGEPASDYTYVSGERKVIFTVLNDSVAAITFN